MQGGKAFEGRIALGLCGEYLMQVSPAHRLKTLRVWLLPQSAETLRESLRLIGSEQKKKKKLFFV